MFSIFDHQCQEITRFNLWQLQKSHQEVHLSGFQKKVINIINAGRRVLCKNIIF